MNRWCFLSVRVSYNDIIYWPRSDLKWKWLSLTRELWCGNMSGGVWRRGDLVVVGLSVLMLLYLLAPDCRCQSFFIKLVILFQQFHCFGHVYVGFYILKEISRYFIVTFEWFSTFRNRLRINVDNFADLYSSTTLQSHYPLIFVTTSLHVWTVKYLWHVLNINPETHRTLSTY